MRDKRIEAELRIPINQWLGYPRCHFWHCDCVYPQHPGEAKACFRCEYNKDKDM